MGTFSVCKRFEWKGDISERMAMVMRMFGVNSTRLREGGVEHRCEVEINEGDIVYITGPSGAGKSVLLKELEKSIDTEKRVNLDEIRIEDGKALVDCVGGDLNEAMRILSSAGLNDVFCILNEPMKLSEGQKYRYKLATAMGMGKKYIFADEFCTNLDRITAAVIAYNIRRFAEREKVTFILGASKDDIVGDLQPDVIIQKELSGETEIVYKRINHEEHE